jgi:hypothetical protein
MNSHTPDLNTSANDLYHTLTPTMGRQGRKSGAKFTLADESAPSSRASSPLRFDSSQRYHSHPAQHSRFASDDVSDDEGSVTNIHNEGYLPPMGSERSGLYLNEKGLNGGAFDYDMMPSKSPGRKPMDVYDAQLAWWRAGMRRMIVERVRRESGVIARMQARSSCLTNFHFSLLLLITEIHPNALAGLVLRLYLLPWHTHLLYGLSSSALLLWR